MRKLIVACVVVVVAACGSSSTTPGPSGAAPSGLDSLPPTPGLSVGSFPAASPAPTPTATAGPTTGPDTGTAAVLLPGSAVEVAIAELNLRETPSTSGKRVAILKRGAVLLVSPADQRSFGWGPVRANGYRWYPVMVAAPPSGDGKLAPLPASPLDFSEVPVSGWVAADGGDAPFLAPLPPRCPTTVDLLNVEAMLPAERLACFGEAITLEGTFGCGGCGGVVVGTFAPDWLASPLQFDFLSVKPSERFGPLALHFAPDGPSRPAAGSIIRVTVHLDDPRAKACTMVEGVDGDATAVDPRTAVLACRERFVVERFEVLGTDPDFPLG